MNMVFGGKYGGRLIHEGARVKVTTKDGTIVEGIFTAYPKEREGKPAILIASVRTGYCQRLDFEPNEIEDIQEE